MSNRKYTIVVVGTGDPGKLPVWVGYLKAYMENKSSMKGRVEMPLVFPPTTGSFDGLLETIKRASPDMVTFTPHEDWNTPSMLKLCSQLRAWNAGLPLVICAENPRNRMQLEAARRNGAINYLIHGEAEKPLERLVRYCADGDGDLEDCGSIITLVNAWRPAAAN